MAEYENHGVRFDYPDGWLVEEEQVGPQTTVSVGSDETSFWSLSLFEDQPDPDAVLESALDAFRDEYDELDFYEVLEPAAPGEEVAACDLQFVCLELVSNASLRAFRGPGMTVLVWYQSEDREFGETREILEGITRSLEWSRR